MKYLIIFLLFFVNLYPQQWVQQNVNPYSFLSPQKVIIVNDSTWFINTSGTLLRTTDAGINFTTIFDGTYPNKYAFEFFFFNKELKVCLYDPPHAKYELVTSTDMGNLFQTTNTYLPLNGTQWIKINFTDELHGYTLESYANDDTYSITSDGGKTWNANQLNGLCDIHFIDKLNGIMSVQNTNYLYRTTNGGSSWYKIFFPDSSNYSKNYFTPMDSVIFMTLWRYKDVYHKFEFGSDNLIKLVKNPFPEDNPNALYLEEKEIMFNFYSPLKIVYISTNSGKLWYKRNAPDINITYYSVLSDKSILAFGRDLSIYRSYDFGITWHCLTKPSFYLRDVHILNEKFSLIAGSNILKTTNGGINWDIIFTNFFAHNIYALSKNNFLSYAKYTTDEFMQTFGHILQSFDGGTNWDTLFTTNQDIELNIYFKDSLNGFIYGPKTFIKTTNAGITWEINQDTLLLSKTINSISFASNDVGFIAASEDGFRTVDGGKNWFIDDNVKGYLV
ncbi:MAG TPA: hypothetical protein VFF33_05930 [Ignavibacteriaceae bacterium]|nr:hypothetical protein [Ignavibacteriaceae bacterium]